MHEVLLSIVLGIVEGLTEFLPVSSTAHLRICQAILGIDLQSPYWKMFTIVIQLGAILSLFAYFSRRILGFLRTFPKGERGDRTVLTHPLTLTLIASVVTIGPCVVLTRIIGKNLSSLAIMGATLLLGGIVMWIVDALFGAEPSEPVVAAAHPAPVSSTGAGGLALQCASSRIGTRTDDVERMTVLQSIWIGACQILSAVFPGTSRSMSTIAAGQVAGLSRSAALEFSFLLSIPTMLAATGYELGKTVFPQHSDAAGEIAPLHMNGHDWAILGIGTIVSFMVALGVVAWFMNWVRRRGFIPFAIYRIVVGIAVLIWAYRLAHGQP